MRMGYVVIVLALFGQACGSYEPSRGNDERSADPVKPPIEPKEDSQPPYGPTAPIPRIGLLSLEQRTCTADEQCEIVPTGRVCECRTFQAANTAHASDIVAWRQKLASQACPEMAECLPPSSARALCSDGYCTNGRAPDFSCASALVESDARSLKESHPPLIEDTKLPGPSPRPQFRSEAILGLQVPEDGRYEISASGPSDSDYSVCVMTGDCQIQSDASCVYCTADRLECTLALWADPTKPALVLVRDCEGCSVKYLRLEE